MDKATEDKILEMAALCDGCLEKSYRDIDGCWNCENRGTYDGAMKMAEWKRQQMIEKTIDWLDSIMYYVSKEDKRLVCNFTNFDELINYYKEAMIEE